MTDSATPISPAQKPKRPRVVKPTIGLRLIESPPEATFTTRDVFNGLRGVCRSIEEQFVGIPDITQVHHLAMASVVLSSILQERVELAELNPFAGEFPNAGG